MQGKSGNSMERSRTGQGGATPHSACGPGQ